jgi:hypothetical protein
VATSPAIDRQSGFATPAATAISLALAIVVAAVMQLAVTNLKAARSEFRRTQAEYALDGASLEAGATLLASTNQERVRWSAGSDVGPVEIVAEPEARKLRLKSAAEGEGAATALAAQHPAAAATNLAAVGEGGDAETRIATADPSPTWRRCARSLISRYGELDAPQALATAAPKGGPETWRIGQLWRIRVTDNLGWTDDRIVRFTGSRAHPFAIAARDFGHLGRMGEACDAIVGAVHR